MKSEPVQIKVLSLSDKIVPFVYSLQIRNRFQGVELLIGCGDLPYYYLEYALTALNAPMVFVRGNHDHVVEYGPEGCQRTHPHGAIDLHRRHYRHRGLLMAGVEGSLRYRPGEFQYNQAEMWGHVLSLAPGMLVNRLRYGRFLDVFVTHAPAAGIHDRDDLPHRGIKAFRWLIEVFRPTYFFHGHIHLYHPDSPVEAVYKDTRVINAFGFREADLVIEETN
jgi:Icc-related predicted phosphoesterase